MTRQSALKDLTKPTAGAPTVYVLAGLAGHVLQFRPLAQRLRPDWHLRGVLYPAFVDYDMACPSIEDLAGRMIVSLSELPRDPVFLGYSIGGTVAFEMASWLAAKGHHPTVVMIDSAPRYLRSRSPWQERLVVRLVTGTRRVFWRWPQVLFRRLRRGADHATVGQPQKRRFSDGIPVPDWIAPESPLIRFYRESRIASRHYVPKPASVRIVMIRAISADSKAWLRRIYWPRKDHNWHLVAEVAGVVPCVGDHLSIIKPDSLDRLSDAVDKALTIAFKNRKSRGNGAVRED